MQVPLEIAFHHIESSDWAEAEIRERVADLEKIYDRLTSCRVRVDQRASNTDGTIPPVVHIELGMPGRPDVVVSHEPDHLMRKYQRPDLHKAINEAFRIAERQLLDIKEQRDGRTKGVHHDGPNQALGQIAEIDPGGEFDSCSRRKAPCSTSIATPCCREISTTCGAATRSTTSMPWATPARLPARSGETVGQRPRP